MQRLRHAVQAVFLYLALGLTLRNLLMATKANVESYCPAGGLESIIFYLKTNAFLCATSGINLILFLAVLVATVTMGRVFCSWVCPVGTFMEAMSSLGAYLGIASSRVWKGRGDVLRWVKYPVLIAVMYYTYTIMDLIFRSYCPYYVIFSGQEHEIAWWSKWLMLVILGLTVVFPFFWCRILCPFGAFLSIGKTVAPICPAIQESGCTSCRACERACPQQIAIVDLKTVRHGECTQCLRCVDACQPGCLTLQVGYGRWRRFAGKGVAMLLPVAILVVMLGGIVAAFNFPMPTYIRQFPAQIDASKQKKVEMIVKGVRCRRSSMTLAKILERTPGIFRLETYVGEFRIVLMIDPAVATPEVIRGLINNGLDVKDKAGVVKNIRPFEVEKILGEN